MKRYSVTHLTDCGNLDVSEESEDPEGNYVRYEDHAAALAAVEAEAERDEERAARTWGNARDPNGPWRQMRSERDAALAREAKRLEQVVRLAAHLRVAAPSWIEEYWCAHPEDELASETKGPGR